MEGLDNRTDGGRWDAAQAAPLREPARPDELAASQDEVLRTARGRSTVLKALTCQRRGCRKTLAWLVVFHDPRNEGELRLELAAPVRDEPVDAADRPGTWVAFALEGKLQTREARSRYIGGLAGDATIRITCRCGERNWLRTGVLHDIAEALRM